MRKYPRIPNPTVSYRGFVNKIFPIVSKKNSHNALKEEYISPPRLHVIICVLCRSGEGSTDVCISSPLAPHFGIRLHSPHQLRLSSIPDSV